MNKSNEVGELFAALAAAKADYKELKKNKINPFFKSKYADLSDLIAATEAGLAKHGLAVIQGGNFTDGRVVISTILGHKSGQWIESILSLKPEKDTPQAIGATLTYGRRYGWEAMTGVSGDVDDDGNHASGVVVKVAKEQDPKIFSVNNDKMVAWLGAELTRRKVPLSVQDEICAALDRKPLTSETIQREIDLATKEKGKHV